MNKPLGLILAGGQATRMGFDDKGLLSICGKTLTEHTISRIINQVSDIIISANRNLDTYRDYGYNVVEDAFTNFQGPLAGIASAMEFANTDSQYKGLHDNLLITACDMPLFPLDFYQRTCNEVALTKKDGHIHVAHDGKRLQPLCILVPLALHQDVNDYLTSGKKKLDAWILQHDPVIIDYSDKPESFCNINTAEDLKIIEKSLPANDK